MPTEPELILDVEFDDRTAREVEQKGFLDHARVQLPDRNIARVCFWDPVRLAQDLETDMKREYACIGEPGPIVIPSHVGEHEGCREESFKRGYFERLERCCGIETPRLK